MYDAIQSGLARTLVGTESNTAGALFDMSNAFLFCGADAWTHGTWDNNPSKYTRRITGKS